ncbi:Eukaryotic translation initiation factor 4E type 2 [Blattella germanica]|nr:Eukaryotic translation initiation factor 4E type 2 [Blattella germanica]
MSNKFEPLKSCDDVIEDEATNKDQKDKDSLAPIPVPAGEHRLQYSYWLWYSRRSPGKQASVQNYDQNLKLIGRFASVEQFWALYSHLARPSDLQSHSDFHLFKIGIKPMWEDQANQTGGKWIVRLRKGLASRCWENLVLAMLGEQFMEDIISLWNRTSADTGITARIRDTLRRVLNLPPNTILEYKNHVDSLKAWKTVPTLKS